MRGVDDFPGKSPAGLSGDPLSDASRAQAGSARGRSPGVYLLAVVDLLLAGLSLYALRYVASAQAYAISTSPEIGSELEAALAGFKTMRIALDVLAGGFVVAALAALSLSRLGFTVNVLWAVLVCLTIVGLPYGLPVLIFLLRRDTRARFGRLETGPGPTGRFLAT